MSTHAKWTKVASDLLVGRTIKRVSYMSAEDMEFFAWDKSPILIELDNGLVLFPSMDDEGNGAGSLFTTSDDIPVLPTI